MNKSVKVILKFIRLIVLASFAVVKSICRLIHFIFIFVQTTIIALPYIKLEDRSFSFFCGDIPYWLFFFMSVFQTSMSWSSITRVWEITSLLMSPGLNSVFLLLSEWSRFFLCFLFLFFFPKPLGTQPSAPTTLSINWYHCHPHISQRFSFSS